MNSVTVVTAATPSPRIGPGWEAYSYNDAIKAYNAQAQAFQSVAGAYVQKLNAYVKASFVSTCRTH
jgi:hypothetical protein